MSLSFLCLLFSLLVTQLQGGYEFTIFNSQNPSDATVIAGGWSLMSVAQLNTFVVQLTDYYNANNGLPVLKGWSSTNCGFMSSGTTTPLYITQGATSATLTPGYQAGGYACLADYSPVTHLKFFFLSIGVVSSMTYTTSFASVACCALGNNPGVYFRFVPDPTPPPTKNPSLLPSHIPTKNPSSNPSKQPTLIPSFNPTNDPTLMPTVNPTKNPSKNPSQIPTSNPTKNPSLIPTNNPSNNPSSFPTNEPSIDPSITPTNDPTMTPTVYPSNNPSVFPTFNPTKYPSQDPTRLWIDPSFFDIEILTETQKTVQNIYDNFISGIERVIAETFEQLLVYKNRHHFRVELIFINEFPVTPNRRMILQLNDITLISTITCDNQLVCTQLFDEAQKDDFKTTVQIKLSDLFNDNSLLVNQIIAENYVTTTANPTKTPTKSPSDEQKFTNKKKNDSFGGILLYVIIIVAVFFTVLIAIILWLNRSRKKVMMENIEMTKQHQQLGNINMEQILKVVELLNNNNNNINGDNKQSIDPTILNLIQMQQQQIDNKGLLNTDEVGLNSNANNGENLLVNSNDNITGINSSNQLQQPQNINLPPIIQQLGNNVKNEYAVMQLQNEQNNNNINSHNSGEGQLDTGFLSSNLNKQGSQGEGLPSVQSMENVLAVMKSESIDDNTIGGYQVNTIPPVPPPVPHVNIKLPPQPQVFHRVLSMSDTSNGIETKNTPTPMGFDYFEE